MTSNQKTGRIIGGLLLFVFLSGIAIFQFLQGPVLFSEDFIERVSLHSDQIIGSVVLGLINGIASILVAVFVLPIFKRIGNGLGYVYLAFAILNFVSIMVDNVSVLSMLELGRAKEGSNLSSTLLQTLVYERHWWTHYLFLLISCFPVFVLYLGLYRGKLVPKVISIFGIVAVLLMFIEELASIFGNSINANMLLPIGLVQFVLPIWLLIKGLNPLQEKLTT